VIVMTTIAVAPNSDAFCSTPRPRSHAPSGCASAASPTMPLRMPIEVMPIWIVDRNRVGCSLRSTAARAPRSPSSASFCRRALRAETSAISDMANSPLISIRDSRIAISTTTSESLSGP